MASDIINKNPLLAATLGKIFGLRRVLSVEIHARFKSFSTVKVEFVPTDEQCDQIAAAVAEYKLVPNEDGDGEESIDQADDMWRSRGSML